ncbi:uncharacterized protein PAC_01807 [Phialocephala subalpina]|uniref:ERCC4 domain-containing protein n=1 Tax=Phialocephala subalpina TaxID=576137 RepID=A0A1L7WGM6_9HELO|nr:uncharacterized protein PAC_01807 [Phialocephala subalpina]
MPVYIDLASSSPAAPPPVAAKAPTNLPANALTYEAPRPVSATWNWDNLSSDSVEAPPVSEAPMSKPTSFLSERTSNTNITKKPANPLKKKITEVIILDGSEDDKPKFENSINDETFYGSFDDPFASSPPPAKRRRVSSSPQASPSKPTLPKASGYKRSVSNIESSARTAGSKVTTAAVSKRVAKTKAAADEIVFTSSPDYIAEAAKKRKEKKRQAEDSEEDDELPELNALRDFKGKAKATSTKGKSTCSIDEDSDDSLGTALPNRSKKTNGISDFEFSSDRESNPAALVRPTKAPSKAPKATSQSAKSALEKYNKEKAKEKAAKEKAEKAKEKADAKDAEKERKRIEKEEKARKKEKDAEIVKANMKRTDKKISIKEMIIELPSCLAPKLKDQLTTFFEAKEAEHTELESTLPVIKWKRKVDREYNEELDRWDSVPKRIQPEKHVMCVLFAKDFVELALGDEGQDLDTHVLKLQTKYDSCKVIYLIEGYMPWIKKNRLTKERQYKDAVRSHIPEEVEPPTTSQRRKKEPEYIDEDLIEDALLNLQVVHGVLIHHCNHISETAEWVLNFTEQISLIPEKLQSQTLDTTFSMESGQVKTGDNPEDTYIKMLQEMLRVTKAVAHGIAAQYPTVQQLVKGFKEEGPLAVAECRKDANGDGSFTNRKVGPAISRRVYNVFMETDPASTAV